MEEESVNTSFANLVRSIHQVHDELATQASRAVNVSLTLRNWLIGLYVQEYEQNGSDRAKYGDKLLNHLSQVLKEKGVSRTEERELRRYRQFYQTYPQIRESLTPELAKRLVPFATDKTKAKNTASQLDGNTLIIGL